VKASEEINIALKTENEGLQEKVAQIEKELETTKAESEKAIKDIK
jgi:hypothetical protein